MIDPTTVIILAGGYGENLVADVQSMDATKHSTMRTTVNSLKRSMQDAGVGAAGPRVVSALVEINHQPSIAGLMVSICNAPRVTPVGHHTWLVVNDPDVDRFALDSSRFRTVTPGGQAIHTDHIISNGSTSAADWQGEVADLKLALSQIGSISTPNVVVVSASLVFLHQFNLQRIIEHSIVRGMDAIAFSGFRAADVNIRGTKADPAFIVDIAEDGQAPRLTDLIPANPEIGDPVALPLVVLRSATLASVMECGSPDLPSMMQELIARGTPVCGVDAQFGVFRLWSAVTFDYLDRFWFYLTTWKPATRPDDSTIRKDFVITNAMAETASIDFDKMYFGPGGYFSSMTGTLRHVIPPTFYMTTYRRQTADILR